MRKTTPSILVALLLSACGSEEQSAPESPAAPQLADIQGSAWELQQLTVLGGFVFTPDDPGKYTLRFESDNRLRGQSDCNTFTGSWGMEASLAVTDFSSTRSMCVPGSIHNYYALYLRAVNDAEWQGSDLLLRTPDEEVALLFSRTP